MASQRAPSAPSGEPPSTLLFAPQAVVPRRRVERIYILERLREYALRFPARRVIIKPRTAPGERTFHVERYHYQTLWETEFSEEPPPPNLEFRYGPLDEILPEVDLLVSVSSTAVFEALSFGVAACILEDFGLRERLGSHFFTGSGLVAGFASLMEDRIPMPSKDWLDKHGFIGPRGLESLGRRVQAMHAAQCEAGLPRAFIEPYYTSERTPQVIAEIEQRFSDTVTPAAGDEERRSRVSLALEDALDRAHRKARKLVRDPRQFVADMTLLRARRGQDE